MTSPEAVRRHRQVIQRWDKFAMCEIPVAPKITMLHGVEGRRTILRAAGLFGLVRRAIHSIADYEIFTD